jgi:alpha-glucosidase
MMPWRALVAGMNSLDSHDTARFLTVVGGDRQRYLAGLTLLFTLPGAPTVFAGAETGIGGADGELSRIPIPWDHPELWDPEILTMHQQLPGLRHRSLALRRGGLRWLAVQDHALTFEREAPGGSERGAPDGSENGAPGGSERVLVHVARSPHDAVTLPSWWFDDVEPLVGEELPTRVTGGWLLPNHGPASHVWRVR